MAKGSAPEERDGVKLTSLDEPVFAEAGVTKRQLIDYLDAVSDRLLPVLRDRPLSVIRTTGPKPFMQKNVPKYTPEWIETVDIWAEASHRNVTYALCNDRRTLLWFGNQRAVEYHPTLGLAADLSSASGPKATDMVLDLDPPADVAPQTSFAAAVGAALLVKAALDDIGLVGSVKTSGAKGVHVFVPVHHEHDPADVAPATRAIARRAEAHDPAIATTAYIKADRGGKVFVDSTRAGGATVAAAYSPRARPGLPVSFPLEWNELTDVTPTDFTVLTAIDLMADRPSWHDALPRPQRLSDALIAEGHEIPVARVAAMHEGKRRKRAADQNATDDPTTTGE